MNACKCISHDSGNLARFALLPQGRSRRLASNNPTPNTKMTTMKNKVQLVGRIGKDPELKTVGSGLAMLRMSIATNERFKAADGEWKDDTQWHPVVAWGKQAERLASSLRKGSGIVLEGRLMHRSYEAKDGSKRYITEVVMSNFQLLPNKREEAAAA